MREKIHVVNSTMELSDCIGAWSYDEKHNCYCLEDVVYTPNPSAVQFQRLNIYVPAAYMNPDGTLKEGAMGKYTTQTAPVIFENNAAGYAEMMQHKLDEGRNYGGQYLERGMIYIHCGCRGRQTMDAKGNYIGKSPISLVDFKTAIRFIKHNRNALPGLVDKMVSIGWSAGGAMSALIGVTGDNTNYAELLEENGAFMDESDAVFAAQVYCPIIDLEHADAAYEWQFRGQYKYEPSPFGPGGELDGFRKELSYQLAEDYVEYFNGLGLKHSESGEALVLGVDGRSGTAYEYLMQKLSESATIYLEKLEKGELEEKYTVSDYINGNYEFETVDIEAIMERNRKRDEEDRKAREEALLHQEDGEEVEGFGHRVKVMGPPPKKWVKGDEKSNWLLWDGTKATVTDLDSLRAVHRPRMKACPSFDFLDATCGENQLFGNAMVDYMHFSEITADSIAKLAEKYPKEAAEYVTAYKKDVQSEGMEERIYKVNPLNFIGTKESSKQAEHFRIHVGGGDADTSYLMSLILAVKLQNAGISDVIYQILWGQPHCEADYKGECADWIESLI